MTPDIKQDETHWQQTISAFHAYLQQTVKLLAYKQEITDIDAPLQPTPRKAKSRKPTQVVPEVKPSNPVPLVPEDNVQAAFKPSRTRHYASPLWVDLGNEDPGHSKRKTKYKKKAK